MTENKDSKYKFNSNLIKASESKDIKEAKNEWQLIWEEKREDDDRQCICQRKVKNVIYMYNIKTKNTIIVGKVCSKKFEMNCCGISNPLLKNILKSKLTKGEYTNIDNILTYCQSVQEQLLNYFNEKYESIKKSIDDKNNYNLFNINYYKQKIHELFIDINELLEKYNLEYLEEIKTKINKLCKKVMDYEYEYYKNKKLEEENEIKRKKDQEEREIKRKKDQEEREIKRKNDQEEREIKCKKDQEEREIQLKCCYIKKDIQRIKNVNYCKCDDSKFRFIKKEDNVFICYICKLVSGINA